MRINEIILEDSQLDELSALGAGQKVGKFGGNIVQGTRDFFSGIKQGYKQARTPAGDQPDNTQSPGTTTGSTTPATSQSTTQSPSTTVSNQTSAAPTGSTIPVTQPSSTPAASGQTAPASKPATINAPAVAPNVEAIKKAYTNLDTTERDKLKSELEIIDDHERLATGTNESLDDLLKLSGI